MVKTALADLAPDIQERLEMVVIRHYEDTEGLRFDSGHLHSNQLTKYRRINLSKQPTTQEVHSTDQKWLEEVRQEAEQYRGLRTTLYEGKLVIHLIDSDKYWRKRNRRKKKVEDEYADLYDKYQ